MYSYHYSMPRLASPRHCPKQLSLWHNEPNIHTVNSWNVKELSRFTLCYEHSREPGNLVLGHSVPHCLPNSGDIACWLTIINAAIYLSIGAKKRKYKILFSYYIYNTKLPPPEYIINHSRDTLKQVYYLNKIWLEHSRTEALLGMYQIIRKRYKPNAYPFTHIDKV